MVFIVTDTVLLVDCRVERGIRAKTTQVEYVERGVRMNSCKERKEELERIVRAS
jgi:hypothetical protein